MTAPKPTVNMNGDTRESLIAVHMGAADALGVALSCVRYAAPHGRNYPDTTLYKRDREAHSRLCIMLQDALRDYTNAAEALITGVSK